MADPVSDHDEIRSLLARLAHATDTGEIDEYLDCFTQDAVLEPTPNPTVRGRDELAARAQSVRLTSTLGPGSHVRHALTTDSITVQRDDDTSRSVGLLLRGGEL